MKNTYSHITHECIPPFINKDSEILILGSLPSVKSREEQFYYAHKSNRFWSVLLGVFDAPTPRTIEEKKQLLTKYKIALYDVIYECDIIGSSDASIRNTVPINIKKDILDKCPNIRKIILTGSKSVSLFDEYLASEIDPKIKVHRMPSTSSANAKISLAKLVEIYDNAIKG